MQEREQKWYSGMLGVTFNANEGRITIFRSMLEALGWPTYYRFLYNWKMGQIAVQACKAENAGAHRVTRLNETNSCEIKCVAFSRMIYQDAHWNIEVRFSFDRQLISSEQTDGIIALYDGVYVTEVLNLVNVNVNESENSQK